MFKVKFNSEIARYYLEKLFLVINASADTQRTKQLRLLWQW
jgi:hypothetical protein